MEESNVCQCDRCLRTFDKIKIIQGIYGTQQCNKCAKELQHHEIQRRVAQWNQPIQEDVSIPINQLL
jgi:hypothetical protein